ncbi:hypothetical protein [Stieleria marina]
MSHPIVGWESKTSVPNHKFSELLSSRSGHLFYEDVDLAQLFMSGERFVSDLDTPLSTPLEFAFLPTIRRKVHEMQQVFADVIDEVGYGGSFEFAFASKANTTEKVVRTALDAGAHLEMSSAGDVEIATRMIDRNHLPPGRQVIANGFKSFGSDYAKRLEGFRRLHDGLTVVVDSISELKHFCESGLEFDIGLRQKRIGQKSEAALDEVNSRFGLSCEDSEIAAKMIEEAPNLRLTMYHTMVGTQMRDPNVFVDRLQGAMHAYAKMRQRPHSLSIFNFGGGMPVAHTLEFEFDYHTLARLMLTNLQQICGEYGVPVPNVMGEFGRYTTAEHAAYFFRIANVKDHGAALPWYMVDGSIMTSFPDVWGLDEHFIVLPLNHLDRPFQRVQLGGMTCDHDDTYPPRGSATPLYLPTVRPGDGLERDGSDDLFIGFFNVGAYQKMLRGVGAGKYCVLPSADELVMDSGDLNQLTSHLIPGQTIDDVLGSLGYGQHGRTSPYERA